MDECQLDLQHQLWHRWNCLDLVNTASQTFRDLMGVGTFHFKPTHLFN
uniref:Uncharacterized protein n=1 Tax=Picea glauca TaxID=3330 RepID=A0A101M3A9_PICGL|nr:hypothetical protein ABT39_MTgene16 [Picea glauca]